MGKKALTTQSPENADENGRRKTFDAQKVAEKVGLIELTVADLVKFSEQLRTTNFTGQLTIDGGARIDEAHGLLIDWLGKMESEYKKAVRIPKPPPKPIPESIPEPDASTGPNVAKSDVSKRSAAVVKKTKNKPL